ncbi:MAG: hypothetical protein IJK02_09715 [Clostridia bacterium]|nr:hypothetical protein [Clostridia bacterium]
MSFGTFLVRHLDRSGQPLTAGVKLIESRYYTGTDFLASAQGITNDGVCYYCTGTFVPMKFNGLAKIEMRTGRVVSKKEKYLPEALARQGFNHYGGCTYFEKKLYVAIEDKNREHPCIGVFDAATLSFTGEYRILGPEIQPDGNLPWCAADAENRLLYTGFFDHCDRINQFDADGIRLIKKIPLDRVLEHTQGGEMWDGKIYVSCHDTWRKKHIYRIDPVTGHVETVMERDARFNLVESEGITVCPMPDGSFFHQLDVIYPLGLAIRRYTAPVADA